MLAYRYFYGYGCVISRDESIEWCKKSASNGCKLAVALEMFWGIDCKEDFKKSFEMLFELYLQDLKFERPETITIVNLLGYCHMTGKGTKKSFDQAVVFLNMAADKGQAHSLNNLGIMFFFFYIFLFLFCFIFLNSI